MLLTIEVEPEKVCLPLKVSFHGLVRKCLMFKTYSSILELLWEYETADKECNTTVKSKRVNFDVMQQPSIWDSGISIRLFDEATLG